MGGDKQCQRVEEEYHAIREAVDGVTFVPGELTVSQDGLRLSTGLRSRIVAISGKRVEYTPASGIARKSDLRFHEQPDAGACFVHPQMSGHWIYVSNAELSDNEGGVGALVFDRDGNVVHYDMVLTKTNRNCGGGRTPWNTWISCEEDGGRGQCYEVDPTGQHKPTKTQLGTTGGNFESVAYDDRNPEKMSFYVTHDDKKGELRQFRPSKFVLRAAYYTNFQNVNLTRKVLTTPGKMKYLVLDPDNHTFRWSSNKQKGQKSAKKLFGGAEGIDIRNGMLYFTSKLEKRLFILNLDRFTYTMSSTEHGDSFQYQPDQIKFILGSDNANTKTYNEEEQILYFCEDGGQKTGTGVYGRTKNGRVFTILEGVDYRSENTGLAFSPNRKFMYIAFQKNPGTLLSIWREDGKTFGGEILDIKYHAEEDMFRDE